MRVIVTALALSLLVGGCGDAPDPDVAVDAEATGNLSCPAVPPTWQDSTHPVWPAEVARGLVPTFDDLCATPTAPELFGSLNEAAAMSGHAEAVALGVLHDADAAVATFTVTRVAADTPGLGESLSAGGGTITEVDDLELAWQRSEQLVTVYWLDGRDLVTLAADDAALAARAAAAWLGATRDQVGVDAPAQIAEFPSDFDLPSAVRAGMPLVGLPDDYKAMPLNPIIMAGSDLADAVGIFDEPVQQLGAAIILRDGHLVATAMGWRGHAEGVATTPEQLYRLLESEATPDTVVGHVKRDDLDVVLVGVDDAVSALATAWQG